MNVLPHAMAIPVLAHRSRKAGAIVTIGLRAQREMNLYLDWH
jgi:hypothetical protein